MKNIKDEIITAKATAEQKALLRKTAEDNGMKLSGFLIHAGLNFGKNITPDILCRIESIISKCTSIAKESDSNVIDSIRKEADSLWEYLS